MHILTLNAAYIPFTMNDLRLQPAYHLAEADDVATLFDSELNYDMSDTPSSCPPRRKVTFKYSKRLCGFHDSPVDGCANFVEIEVQSIATIDKEGC